MTFSRVAAVIAAMALGVAGLLHGAAGWPAYGAAGWPAHAAADQGTPPRPFTAAPPTITSLQAPKPAWFTDALARRARAAAESGAAIPLPDDADVPTTSQLFPGIRPGTQMISPSGCTLSYVFGTAANLFIGTAGHCTRVGQDVTVVSAPGVLLTIGTTVKSVARGIGNDFALIRIRPQMRRYVSASLSYFGGPTGQATPEKGDAIVYVGHGLVVGFGGTGRVGIVSYRTGTGFAWLGTGAAGDSGAPVRLVDGRAVGGLTHVIVDPAGSPTSVAGTTLRQMQRIAGLPLVSADALPQAESPLPVQRQRQQVGTT